MEPALHPILSCRKSIDFENEHFKCDKQAELDAMYEAGHALGVAVADEFGRLFSVRSSLLLLLGKGHNAGDAIHACVELLRRFPELHVAVFAVFGRENMVPEVGRLLDQLMEHPSVQFSDGNFLEKDTFGLILDGIFGMQFRPPLSVPLEAIFGKINSIDALCRVAVDLPSGLSDHAVGPCLRADVTYATGIFKTPLTVRENRSLCGRIRYLNIGFFRSGVCDKSHRQWVYSGQRGLLTHQLRPVESDKRSFGHLLLVAGSQSMPGAMLMAARSALQSGVGLLSILTPRCVVEFAAAALPEAMWIPWFETAEGTLALEGASDLKRFSGSYDAVLLGPGLGKDPETQALLDVVIETMDAPFILDADALVPERLGTLKKHMRNYVLTPHWGEFKRISGISEDEPEKILAFANRVNAVLVLKDSFTRIFSEGKVIHIPSGNPVLARGGSGDLLAGLVAGYIARKKQCELHAVVAEAVYMHGSAADELASLRGEHYVTTTQILPFINASQRHTEPL
jgi:hydroxyethylthiazole kinase-like uncharacterized protein yjeF